MPSNHLILYCPLLLLPSIFPSIRVFSNESALRIRWPKYWSFSFNISPSKEHPGLISFRMDWLDLLAVQRTLMSLLQHHSSKASILQLSAFFTVQLSYPYMTTGKTIALTRWTFVGKVMSLLFNMLSWLVITFLPRSKRLLISWLQSPSAVILEPMKMLLMRAILNHQYWILTTIPGSSDHPSSLLCRYDMAGTRCLSHVSKAPAREEWSQNSISGQTNSMFILFTTLPLGLQNLWAVRALTQSDKVDVHGHSPCWRHRQTGGNSLLAQNVSGPPMFVGPEEAQWKSRYQPLLHTHATAQVYRQQRVCAQKASAE